MLETGDQAVIENASGAVPFAGYEVTLDNVSGAMGFSSAAGYVVVASGSAAAAGETARAGEILILMPRGEGTSAQLYDAGRYAGSWDAAAAEAHPSVYRQLNAVAGRQKWKLFLGRLAPTSFNIAAPGSADAEMARRSIVGEDAVRQIRFSAQQDSSGSARAVVEAFAGALSSGDIGTVAALMDPAPFGAQDLRHGGNGARYLLAERIIGQRDWSDLLPAQAELVDDTLWTVPTGNGSAYINLRRTTDISFVQSIDFQAGE
ncbi:hypothetical protein [Aquisalinus flavus]|uniref:Uncharacterized protein n=2 Tax=Aquisalinus flavus TaxID=1526572 RepID=A0A8J2V3L3_9PROT|nr:hypothetical protein [Aquisalinus flavus]MBD0425648.1 hypothetical protein [Aquisalinus flavus]UNE48736.1 hypothetical protein FF099_12080 [Aquisalinus flavus]GGD14365.1 hypothetical protein GCM10011342_23940 [Aquisalinus flavus]